ncbi:hypothetical protein N658DRAFT_414522 [Parathielavia hyrcaniae]|uniref:Uncharacterized protein n=1 Tax=Parathielavia hyrcaniae TaxID=113614 RepID=A0AAN6QDM6_9PEZI|nr:hypothetical protein N658DRAFT_414522 [Parathielavia hyrcaniae]
MHQSDHYATRLDAAKSGALWTEEPVPSDEQPVDVRSRPSILGWWWELLSLAFSIGCLISIVAILFTYQDRPQTDWHGGFLSITGTIAIFSTAANLTTGLAIGACLSQYKWLHFRKSPHKLTDLDLIEEAGRGPLGSLILLVKQPFGLATIGAVVVMLSAMFDVFVQQTVTFEPRDVASNNGTARLGLAHVYDSGATPGALGTFHARPSMLDLSMLGAVFRGMFNLGSPAVFDCPTSKCEWNGTYYSLGFASTCADVTEATLRLHPNASAVWNGTASKLSDQVHRILTTPGGVRLAAPVIPTQMQTFVSVNATNLMSNNAISGKMPMPPDIVRIGVFRAQVDSVNFEVFPENMTIFECDISLAAYRYSNLVSSGQNLTIGKHELIRLDPGVLSADGQKPSGSKHVTFSQSGLPLLSVSASDIAGLQLLFTSTRFSGRMYEGLGPTYYPEPQGTGDAFRSGDVAQTMRAMVDSMTDQLRATYNVTAVGASIHSVVFIEVDWAWITLPLAVQIITVAFMIIIIIKSVRTPGLPLWKSSTVAALTYDVRFREDEDDVGRLGTGIRSTKELEALAESWTARLELPERK